MLKSLTGLFACWLLAMQATQAQEKGGDLKRGPGLHAVELYMACKESPGKLKQDFDKKSCTIRGTIYTIGRDAKGTFQLTFALDFFDGGKARSKEIPGLMCFLKDNKVASSLEKGQEITLEGELQFVR